MDQIVAPPAERVASPQPDLLEEAWIASRPSSGERDFSLRAWWLGALLFTTASALVLLGTWEWEHYRRLLKWRGESLSTGDRVIVFWLLWTKSVLPLLPVLLGAGLLAAFRRFRLASIWLTLGAIGLYFWLAADLTMQAITGSHVLDYLPYLQDALESTGHNHLEWAGDTATLITRSLVVLAVVVTAALALAAGSRMLASRLIGRWPLLRTRHAGLAFAAAFLMAAFLAVPAQALVEQPLMLRRLHVAMPVDLSLFIPHADDPWTLKSLLGISTNGPPRGVRIVSILPDPAPEDDAGHEQATLHNFARTETSLAGWRLRDREGREHRLNGTLKAGETITITFPAGGLDLDNEGDELQLLDEQGSVHHSVWYKGEWTKYGAVMNFREEGDYDDFLLKVNQGVQSMYYTMREDLLTPRPVDEDVPLDSENPPHVVYLVLESFRDAAVSPQLMARLDAWSKQGLRLGRHYAGSNSSHLGLFTLLYSRSPLVYYPTLRAGIPPQTTHTLRASGYTCSFITSGDCTNFRKMDKFLNEEQFHQVIIENGADWQDWPQRDRRSLEHVRNILQQARGPQFVMAFLMSTHFPYAFPPEWDKHQPSGADEVSRANWRSFDASVLHNRYRNAALYLEHELMRLIETLDPQRHIIVVTGDHGESMSEDGALAHASRGSEAQTRVPLLMVGPGLPPRVIQQPTTHSDVLPTLLHALAGKEVKLRYAHGRDVLSGRPLGEQVLICPYRWKDPYDLILVRGADRMQFKIRLDRAVVEAYGFCDTAGNLDLSPSQRWTAVHAPLWTEALRREFLRIAQ